MIVLLSFYISIHKINTVQLLYVMAPISLSGISYHTYVRTTQVPYSTWYLSSYIYI